MKRSRICELFCLILVPATIVWPQRTGQAGDAGETGASPVPSDSVSSAILTWMPQALVLLGQQAEVRNSFVLDRTTLGAMAALLPESDREVRPTVRKLDGIGVHLYRFHDFGWIDGAAMEQVREAYHARGWKHLVTGRGASEPGQKPATDLWLVVDGVQVRGGALLVTTPRSVNLVTFTGDLSPIDLLHLRGHFGIPNFSGDSFADSK